MPKRLTHVTSRRRIRHWRKHKLQTIATAKALRAIDEKVHGRRADRMQDCANRLEFIRDGEQLQLRTAHRCRIRLCQVCTAAKSRQDYAILAYRVQEHARLYSRALPILLTLTVPNVPADELPGAVTHLLESFRRLSRKLVIKRATLGWHRSLEVTFRPNGEAHPHLHVLMFVRDGYFAKNSPIYLTQPDWCRLWSAVTGHEHTIVDVRRIGRDRKGELILATDGLYELTKYLVKPGGLLTLDGDDWTVDPTLLEQLHKAVHKRRLRDVGGTLRKIKVPKRSAHPTDEELEAAHAEFEIYQFGNWVDVLGEIHGPDYWQRAPPEAFDPNFIPLIDDDNERKNA